MTTGRYPSPEHERLAALVGTWKTTGEIKSVGPDPAGKLEGTDSYEWLPGGHFLLHRVDVQMGRARSQSIEVIGVDTTRNGYSMHSFDDNGNHVVTHGVVVGSNWTIVGEEIRFSGTISEDSAIIVGHWERLVDGVWLPWIDVRLARMT
jgi:hypothetical protein